VGHNKRERYSKEFRRQAVERMNACDNIARLSRELGVARHLLYHWRDRLEHAHAPVGWMSIGRRLMPTISKRSTASTDIRLLGGIGGSARESRGRGAGIPSVS